ncbi:MAG: hypothetical protein ACRD3H_14665 [Terriglobales bacterium]|jgi:hypothetical protein
MSETGIQFGIFGMALVRAAEAMLRSLGGSEIRLLLPRSQPGDDPGAQLGLVDPGVEEVRLSPVVVRNLPTASTGPRRRLEFLIPAAALSEELSSRNVASAEDFFAGVMGVVYDSDLFHIEGFTSEYFGGMAYLYRLVGVE